MSNKRRQPAVEEAQEEGTPSRFFAILLSFFIVLAIMVVYALVFR